MAVIIDKNADSEIFKALDKLNIKYYKSTTLDFLYKPVCTHPDMQIHFTDSNTAVVAPYAYEYYKSILPLDINLIKGHSDPGNTYPADCAYNVAKLGKRIIGNLFYMDKTIEAIYRDKEYEFINVKQGYTKCNLCIVDSNSVITADEGLFKVLADNGIQVLKINPKEIDLKHFKYGFIGGASGFIAEKKLGFCGKISEHSSFDSIREFLKERSIEIIQLSQNKLSDFGSILYIKDFIS